VEVAVWLGGGLREPFVRHFRHVDAVTYTTVGIELRNHANGSEAPRVIAMLPWANLLAIETPSHDSPIGDLSALVM